MRYSKPRRILFFLLIVPLLVGLLAGAVMLLWNAILPEVLGARPVTYWQALGLLVLSRLLFGGWGNPPRGNPPRGRSWKKYHRGHWNQMSEEEKARLREAWQKRCRRS